MSENPIQIPGPYRASEDFILEIAREVSEYEKILLKSAILVNGGAAVALLAFIGSIWLKGGDLSSLTTPLIFFISGMLVAVVCTYIGYSNLMLGLSIHQIADSTGQEYEEVEITILKFFKITAPKLVNIRYYCALLLYAISFGLFIIGVYQAVEAFDAHLISYSPDTSQ